MCVFVRVSVCVASLQCVTPDNRSLSLSLFCHISTTYPDWLVGFICCVSVVTGTHHRNVIGIFIFILSFIYLFSSAISMSPPLPFLSALCRSNVSRGGRERLRLAHTHTPLSVRVCCWLVTIDSAPQKKKPKKTQRQSGRTAI